MSKKKLGSEEKEWKVFINNIFSRRRADRRHKISKDYIIAVADAIHKTNPTKEILINTLGEFAATIYPKAYFKRMSDEKFFRDKREKRFDREWKKELENIEDYIHPKLNQQSK